MTDLLLGLHGTLQFHLNHAAKRLHLDPLESPENILQSGLNGPRKYSGPDTAQILFQSKVDRENCVNNGVFKLVFDKTKEARPAIPTIGSRNSNVVSACPSPTPPKRKITKKLKTKRKAVSKSETDNTKPAEQVFKTAHPDFQTNHNLFKLNELDDPESEKMEQCRETPIIGNSPTVGYKKHNMATKHLPFNHSALPRTKTQSLSNDIPCREIVHMPCFFTSERVECYCGIRNKQFVGVTGLCILYFLLHCFIILSYLLFI
jgi:hypothetical protein